MNPLAWLRVRKHLAIIVGLLTLFAHLVVYGCIWVGLELDGGISRHELAEILIPLSSGYAVAVITYVVMDGARPATPDDLKDIRSGMFVFLALSGPLMLILGMLGFTLLINSGAIYTGLPVADRSPDGARNVLAGLAAATAALQGLFVPALFGAQPGHAKSDAPEPE